MIMVDINQNFGSKKSTSKESFNLASRQARGDYISCSGDIQQQPPQQLAMSGGGNQPYADGLAGTIVPVLRSIREPLAEYQEKKGIARNTNYTFLALVSAVCQYVYSVLLNFGNMVYNLFPIIDAFLLILRFLLDKGIDCLLAQSGDRIIKSIVFLFEFVAIVIMVLAISGLILVPLSVLFSHVFHKVWNAVF